MRAGEGWDRERERKRKEDRKNEAEKKKNKKISLIVNKYFHSEIK